MKIKRCLLIPSLLGLLSCSSSNGESPDPVVTPTDSITYIALKDTTVTMIHPGGLHSKDDFDRVKTKVAAGAEPWASAFNKLIANSHCQVSYKSNPQVKLIRGGSSAEEPDPDNYSTAMNDVAAAYQLGLRWKVTGDAQYAQAAINILNGWANTCKKITGDPNMALASGIYGYQFAVAGELLRDYSGWSTESFKAYQQWMLNVFYSENHTFLTKHQGSNTWHYWANWDLCNCASMMGIGILTDRRSIYNEALTYLQYGNGNGRIMKAINHVFQGNDSTLAQLQESGRDQGHATLVISLLGNIFQLAWNQGDDLFGFNHNMYLKACEYTAKYNIAMLDVPFWPYEYSDVNYNVTTLTVISSDSRGTVRPEWSLPYYHYLKIKGVNAQFAKYVSMGVTRTTPEGGGGDYGSTSGGFDQLGCGTLMYSR